METDLVFFLVFHTKVNPMWVFFLFDLELGFSVSSSCFGFLGFSFLGFVEGVRGLVCAVKSQRLGWWWKFGVGIRV